MRAGCKSTKLQVGRVVAFVLLLLTLGCSRSKTPEPYRERQEFIDTLKGSIVTLLKKDESDNSYSIKCSGVWISGSAILTARHCIKGGDDETAPVAVPFYTTSDKVLVEPHYARVMSIDPQYDLALLRYEGKKIQHRFSRLSSGPTFLGMPLHIIGHPLGMGNTYMAGFVSAEREFTQNNKDFVMLQVQAPLCPGNSGSPAFNEAGEVVGVASFVMDKAQSMAFFIPSRTVVDFLHRASYN